MIDPATNTVVKVLLKYPQMLPWSVAALAVSHGAMWYESWKLQSIIAKDREDNIKEHAKSMIRDAELQSKFYEMKTEVHDQINEIKTEIFKLKMENLKQYSELKDLIKTQKRGWFF